MPSNFKQTAADNANPGHQGQPDIGLDATSTIAELLGMPRLQRGSTSDIVDGLETYISKQTTLCKAVKVNLNTIPRGELFYDTVLISYTRNGASVVLGLMLEDSTNDTFTPKTIQYGDVTYSLPNYSSDTHDNKFIELTESVINKATGVAKDNIHVLNSVIIRERNLTPEVIPTFIKNLFARFNPYMLNELMINKLNEIRNQPLHGINPGKEVVDTKVNIRDGGSPIYDEDGSMVSSSIGVSVTSVPIKGADFRSSLNSIKASSNIADVELWVSPVYNPIPLNPGYQPVSNSLYNCLSPLITMTDVRIGDQSTTSKYMLIFAIVTKLLDLNLVKRGISPRSLAALNTLVNVDGADVPAPLDPADAEARFDQIFGAMFNANIFLALSSTPGTFQYIFMNKLIASGSKQSGFAELISACRDLFPNFDPSNRVRSIVSPNVDYSYSGTYRTDNGDVRPLSRVDLAYVMAKAPGQTGLHAEWVRSSAANINPAVRAAMKLKIYDAILPSYEVIDRNVTITFDTTFIQELRLAIDSSGIGIRSNLADVMETANRTFEPFLTPGSGVNFQGQPNPFQQPVGNFGNYHTPWSSY